MSGENNRKCNENVSSFNRDAMSGLMIYQWKGNVRELENVVSRAVILSRGKRRLGSISKNPSKMSFSEPRESSHATAGGY
jgi:DNA-binding NtrC family response regulator